jgi:hypothetical protein
MDSTGPAASSAGHGKTMATDIDYARFDDDVGVPEGEPPAGAGEGVDEYVHGVWACVGGQAQPRMEVWVHCAPNGVPPDAYVKKAGPLAPGDSPVRIVADPVALAHPGLVSHQAPSSAPANGTGAGHGSSEAANRAGTTIEPQKRRATPQWTAESPLPDDAIIDQRSGLVPKEVFLRLAREGAFRSSKVGKRILAQWGEVKAALVARRRPVPTAAAPGHAQGDLDDIRRSVGLVPKGHR